MRSPTRAVARPPPSSPAPAAPLLAPSRAGLSSPGAGVTQPVCPLPAAFPTSSEQLQLFTPLPVMFLSKWSFTSFFQGIATPFQREERGGGPTKTGREPEPRQPRCQAPSPGPSSPARPCPPGPSLSRVSAQAPYWELMIFNLFQCAGIPVQLFLC